MKKSGTIWWIVLLAVLGGGGYYGWQKYQAAEAAKAAQQAAASRPRPVPVSTAPVEKADFPVYLIGLGTVQGFNTVQVRTRVDGQIDKIAFTEGQMVKEGDLLAEIDPRPFQVQVQQAQGQLARDQALLSNALVDLERYRKLWATDSIPKQQLDTQEALVRQYKAAIETDKAQVDAAKLQLTYSRITAPISGRLGLRLVDAGNMVHATDPGGLVTITQIRPIAVVFSVPEDDLPVLMPRMRNGDPPKVEAYDRDGSRHIATGTVLTVDNSIDPTTGTVKVKAQFPNEDDALFPSQFVNARLLLDTKRNVTLVPGVAVRRGTKGAYVYVVGPKQTVEARPVRVGVSEGNDTSIDEGISPGDVVVTDGADSLRDGMTVTQRGQGRASAEQGHS